MKPNREQTISRLTELIFPDNIQEGAVNGQAHEIVTTILAYLDDPDITHLYYEGVSTGEGERSLSKESRILFDQ